MVESIISFLCDNFAPDETVLERKIDFLMDLLQPVLIIWSIFVVWSLVLKSRMAGKCGKARKHVVFSTILLLVLEGFGLWWGMQFELPLPATTYVPSYTRQKFNNLAIGMPESEVYRSIGRPCFESSTWRPSPLQRRTYRLPHSSANVNGTFTVESDAETGRVFNVIGADIETMQGIALGDTVRAFDGKFGAPTVVSDIKRDLLLFSYSKPAFAQHMGSHWQRYVIVDPESRRVVSKHASFYVDY